MAVKLPDFASVGANDPRSVGSQPSYPQNDPVAEGTAALGKGVEKVGGAIADYAAEQLRNRNAVNSALATADLEGNLIRTKELLQNETDPGKIDALKGQLRGYLDRAGKTITDPEHRELWAAQHSVKVAQTEAVADARQTKIYDDRFKAGASAQLTDLSRLAAQASDPEDRENSKRRIGEVIGSMEKAGVIGSEKAQELMRGYGDDILTGHAQWLDANGKPGEALAFVQQNAKLLDPKKLEALTTHLRPRAEVDSAKAALGRAGMPGMGGGSPQPGANDDDIDRALAPIIQRESAGRPLIGWGETDLSGYPLTETGFPDWPGKPGPKGKSTAAGLYQITKTTWDPIAEKLGITDFSPESQRAVARELYRQRGLQPWDESAPSAGRVSVSSDPAAALAPPDLDKVITRLYADPALSTEAREKAISMATARYHHLMAATATERATLKKSLDNGIAALEDGKPWEPDVGAMKRLLPPADLAEVTDKIDEAKLAGTAKTSVWLASPEENDTKWIELQKGLNDPKATDYAKRRKYANAFLAAVKQRDEALKNDPAAFVATVPVVSDARSAIDPKNPTPGTEATIRASLAEQARLGVRRDDQRVLTKAQAAATISEIINADPGKVDLGMQLDGFAKQYGEYWPDAFGDLVRGGVPAMTQTLATMTQPDQAAFRGDFQHMLRFGAEKGGLAKLKEAAPKEDVKQIDADLDNTLEAFRATARSPKLYDAVKESVANLAYWYAFQGKSGSKALASAYEGILGRKYDFEGTFRAPRGTLGIVDAAGESLLAGVTVDRVDDPGGNPEVSPEYRKQISLSAIQRGRWVNNFDDTGLVRLALRRDGAFVPAVVDGKVLEFKFADASALAAKAPPGPAYPMPPF